MIRSYKKTDFSSVLSILQLNTPTYFAPQETQDFIHYLEHELDQYFVAVLDETIVGCGGFNYEFSNNIIKISWDMIHPKFQNHGIGSMLLLHRLEKIKTHYTFDEIVVRTSQFSYKFYEKHGFELIELHHNYWAKGFDMYFMTFRENKT